LSESAALVPPPPEPSPSDGARVRPALAGVPQTLLWPLHNRAAASRRGRLIHDPLSQSIHAALDFDYERHFGRPELSHAIRAWWFDRELAAFAQRHPGCTVVQLGEGLDTQRARLPLPDVVRYSIDMPEALALRERFMPTDAQHRHLAFSATDARWLAEVPADRPVFIGAAGLLMYLPPQEVRELLQRCRRRFAPALLMFDHIPRWASAKTLKGWQKTPHWRAPPMPWGVDGHDLGPLMREWLPATSLRHWPFGAAPLPMSAELVLWHLASLAPGLRERVPGIAALSWA
jgi:O-methyltransferase involved in polyketide biosynthesis